MWEMNSIPVPTAASSWLATLWKGRVTAAKLCVVKQISGLHRCLACSSAGEVAPRHVPGPGGVLEVVQASHACRE